jgi:hypothetical protein
LAPRVWLRGIECELRLRQDDKPLSAAGMKVESPDAEVYVLLVALQFLLDHKAIDAAHEIASSLLAYCQEQDRRSLDPLMASVWFYYSLVCEKKDALPQVSVKRRNPQMPHVIGV